MERDSNPIPPKRKQDRDRALGPCLTFHPEVFQFHTLFGYLPSHILHTRSLPIMLKLQAGSKVLIKSSLQHVSSDPG
jgi:hypothetical protein